MRIRSAVCEIALFVAPTLCGECPSPSALAQFKHQIAYERTEEDPPLHGLRTIRTGVWSRGPVTGFYVHDQLGKDVVPGLRLTYIFGEHGLQGGGGCRAERDWKQCIEDQERISGGPASGSVTLCTATIDLRSVPPWKPSPNDQRKRRIADELRQEIEAQFKYSQVRAIVIRDFNLMDNQITVYIKMPDGDYYQGCGFYANREPHCEGWHLFGQTPLSSIRRWIFERPYRLKWLRYSR